MNFNEFCSDLGVSIRTTERIAARDEKGWWHYAMKCTLRFDGRQLTTPFKQGTGHNHPPSAADVLACLLSDISSVQGNDFETWCGDLGYDTDSRSAERAFEACKAIERKLRRFLGDDFDAFDIATDGY